MKIKYITFNVEDYCVLYKNAVRSVGLLLTYGHHLHHFTKRDVLNHKTSLALPLLLKCLYHTRKGRSHVYVLGVLTLPLSMIFRLDFKTNLMLWYFSLLYRYYIVTGSRFFLLYSLFYARYTVLYIHNNLNHTRL